MRSLTTGTRIEIQPGSTFYGASPPFCKWLRLNGSCVAEITEASPSASGGSSGYEAQSDIRVLLVTSPTVQCINEGGMSMPDIYHPEAGTAAILTKGSMFKEVPLNYSGRSSATVPLIVGGVVLGGLALWALTR